MTIVVTGALGFIGRHIVTYLLNQRHEVIAIVRTGSDCSYFKDSDNLSFIFTDDLFLDPKKALDSISKSVDILIHAAWYVDALTCTSSEKNIDCLIGTINLANAFLTRNHGKFVGIGTCSEYDPNDCLLSISSSINPKSLYGATKAATYLVLNNLFAQKQTEFLWCRVFYLFGPDEKDARLNAYIRNQIEANKKVELSIGTQIRDYLDVKEAARIICEKSLGNKTGLANVCSGVPTTVRQFAESIADEYGRRDLLVFGARPLSIFDPPCVVGVKE